jgi:hypothetical protein
MFSYSALYRLGRFRSVRRLTVSLVTLSTLATSASSAPNAYSQVAEQGTPAAPLAKAELTKVAAASTDDLSSKEAFEAAKELGTVEGWNGEISQRLSF